MTTSAEGSLWLATAGQTDYPRLETHGGEAEFDVAVLGGGLTGLTTALLLKREGARVAVLEARRVGSGVTGCTTAKVTALQQTIYSRLRHRHGAGAGTEAGEVYADASLAGVEMIAELVGSEKIDCRLERRPAVTFAADQDERSTVEEEHEAAREAGLGTTFTEDVDLPFETHGAVRLADQIQLQPVSYVQGLAAAVDGDGSRVFEQTAAISVDVVNPTRVGTESGSITSNQVVVATHYPLLDRSLFFARLEPARSYCIAAHVDGPPPENMSISAGSSAHSIRSYDDLLIVGGEGHTTGARKATPDRYAALEQFARGHWDVRDVPYRWSAQDPVSWDLLPVIGPYHPGSSRLFVASGFHKWGLASGTFAARIIADEIAGRDNPWADTFTPNRIGVGGLPKLAEMNAKVAIDLVGDRLLPALSADTDDIPPGEARVIRDGLGKTGVYRDDAGKLHGVSLRCTHLGCLLRFNGAERSWDCPCHGSRFDIDGSVLEGPATRALDTKPL